VVSMRYKLLGRTGLRVSELCLGAMIFGDHRGGWGASKDEAARIVERFAEAGGNLSIPPTPTQGARANASSAS
jgi:aryl-alcohol dehydrogenase-like predicted oxidoreductase